MILTDAPQRALAVFAHPDDPEVACAGTLAAWVAAGCEAHLVIANSGDKGSSDPSCDPDALAAVRLEEARHASDVLGLASMVSLACPDGELENTVEFRRQLIGLIRTHRPDVVIAPDPTAVYFGNSYVNHHDHRALGWAVLDVSGSMAGGALYEPDTGAAHQMSSLLLAGTLEPDTWVDIGATIGKKLDALRCHASQLHDGDEVVAALVEARAADAGKAAGVRYAEGFRRLAF